jgi:cobalamin biosynthesis Mg chelatase CobN
MMGENVEVPKVETQAESPKSETSQVDTSKPASPPSNNVSGSLEPPKALPDKVVNEAVKDVAKKDSKLAYYAVIGILAVFALIGFLYWKFKGEKKGGESNNK